MSAGSGNGTGVSLFTDAYLDVKQALIDSGTSEAGVLHPVAANALKELDALWQRFGVYADALTEIADVPGRSVTSLIAEGALDGRR